MGVFRAMGGSYGFKTSYYGLPRNERITGTKA